MEKSKCSSRRHNGDHQGSHVRALVCVRPSRNRLTIPMQRAPPRSLLDALLRVRPQIAHLLAHVLACCLLYRGSPTPDEGLRHLLCERIPQQRVLRYAMGRRGELWRWINFHFYVSTFVSLHRTAISWRRPKAEFDRQPPLPVSLHHDATAPFANRCSSRC